MNRCKLDKFMYVFRYVAILLHFIPCITWSQFHAPYNLFNSKNCASLTLLASDHLARNDFWSLRARLIESSYNSWSDVEPLHDLRVKEIKRQPILLIAYPQGLNEKDLIRHQNKPKDIRLLSIYHSNDEGWIEIHNQPSHKNKSALLSQIHDTATKHASKIKSHPNTAQHWPVGNWKLVWFVLTEQAHKLSQSTLQSSQKLWQKIKKTPHTLIRCHLTKQILRVLPDVPHTDVIHTDRLRQDRSNQDRSNQHPLGQHALDRISSTSREQQKTKYPIIIRSDLDMTYLHTSFHSAKDLWQLVRQNAHQRKSIPGMPHIYKQLVKSRTQAQAFSPRPVTFISGSPFFFFRTLMARFKLDQLSMYDLRLKPFKKIIKQSFLQLTPHKMKAMLKEQVAYKLLTLLQTRLDIPSHWQEVLVGDDQEFDLQIYQLYHAITTGRVDFNTLVQILDRQTKGNQQQMWYISLRQAIDRLYKVRSPHTSPAAVHAIFIHQSKSKKCPRVKKNTPIHPTMIRPHFMINQKLTYQIFPPVYFYCDAQHFAHMLKHAHLLDAHDMNQLRQQHVIDSL